MALALVSPRPLRPRYDLVVGRSRLRFYLGDCLEVLPALEPRSVSVVVTSPPYNLGIKYRSYLDDMPRTEYLNWTDRWIRAASEVDGRDGIAVPERRRQADRSVDSARSRAGRPPLLQAAEHHPLGQVDRHRSRGRRSGDRSRARRRGRPLQTDQQRPVRQRLPRVHFSLLAGRPDAARSARGRACPIRISRTSSAGPPPATGCAAAATPGSFPTTRSRAATATGRTRRHFPQKVPEQCIRLHGLDRAGMVLDPFLGLGTSAVAAARLGLDFVGIEMDEEYLREAVRRVKSLGATQGQRAEGKGHREG